MGEEYYNWSEEAKKEEELTKDQFFSALYLWEEGAPDPQIYYSSDDPELGFVGQFVQGFVQKIDYHLTFFPYSNSDKKYNYFIHVHYGLEIPIESPPRKYYIDKWAYNNVLVKKGMIE